MIADRRSRFRHQRGILLGLISYHLKFALKNEGVRETRLVAHAPDQTEFPEWRVMRLLPRLSEGQKAQRCRTVAVLTLRRHRTGILRRLINMLATVVNARIGCRLPPRENPRRETLPLDD